MKVIKVIVDKIPENCFDCDLIIGDEIGMYCPVGCKPNGDNFISPHTKKRPDWCPLITKDQQGEGDWLKEYKSLREAVNEVNKMFWDTDDQCAASEMKLAIEGILATHPRVTKREPEIKACPVCGKKANLIEWDTEQFYIICDASGCPIRTMYYPTAHKAIEAWNALPRKGE